MWISLARPFRELVIRQSAVLSSSDVLEVTDTLTVWDEDPLYERMPEVPGANLLGLGNVDTLGAVALGAMAVGIAGHAATSAIQKKKRDAAEKNSDRKDG